MASSQTAFPANPARNPKRRILREAKLSGIPKDMEINQITQRIISESYEIHGHLGPGLLESVYERVLAKSLTQNGLRVQTQVPVEFNYRGLEFKDGLRIDLLVENKVIVELKSVEENRKIHAKQLLTYLRLSGLQMGLLINFGMESLRDGIKRLVNNYREPPP